jgi:hypothetical protein
VKLVSCDSNGHTKDVTSLAPWVSYLRIFDIYCVMWRKERERVQWLVRNTEKVQNVKNGEFKRIFTGV